LPFDPEDRLMSKRKINKLLPQLQKQQFDIVHIQTPFVAHYAGVYLAKKLGIPCVVSYHTYFEAYFEKYLPWLPSGLLRRVARKYSATQCNQVDGIISPSTQMLEKLREYGAESEASVIPTGLKLDQYKYKAESTFRKKYNIDEDDKVLLYVGRVAHEKNIPFLIDVFVEVIEANNNVKFVIAGEGPAQKSLQNRVEVLDLQEQVIFVGYLDRETELVDCYQSADLFVFSSETETQGLVLLEAMACNLPVVSVASMGSKDVLVEGEGCLISRLDITEFSGKVLSLLTDPAYAHQVANAGKKYVGTWSTEDKARDLLNFYHSTISAYHQRLIPATDYANG
jgi:glycosyltransferase involved in cell wall biosynthesis